jgi:hypothetical protein
MLPPPHAVYTRRHASVDAVQVPLEAKARCAKQNASFAMPVYAQNAIILPSQARDKHRETSKKRDDDDDDDAFFARRNQSGSVLRCVQQPGDLIYVPDGWYVCAS